jgi:hypothetical protein
MKRIFTFILVGVLMGLPCILRGQTLTITEINYNDPSGGNSGDSLEFLEIYNIQTTPIDMTGYQLASGITFTFPATIIPGQGYIIVAKNANAVNAFFGIAGSLQWDAGQGLTNNNGEAVVIKDAAGSVIDSVRYYVTAPWPTTANGLGGSLMKCDPIAMPNLAGSWVAGNITNASMFGTINNYAVFATPLAGCSTPPVYNPVYTGLPFNENFENIWVNGNNLRDVPANCWLNTPATGNNSWRRNDDGYSAYWSNMANGAYTPTGANGTTNSARFHTAASTAGNTGTLDLYLNFNMAGNKKLKFWYINTTGTDSVAVYFSEDGGTTFNFLQKFTATTTWEQKQLMLGTSLSTTCIIKFVATSNNTGSDIGLDEVSVIAAPDNDAGIAEITSPASLVFSSSQNLVVTLANYGNLDLGSVDLNWSIDGGAVNSTTWTGNLPSGSSQAGIDLTSLTLTPLSLSQYKVWTSNPNGNIDGDHNNDTLVKSCYYQIRDTVPYEEHFDNNWIDKFSTHDAPTSYWTNTPATGNNSWRRDDDGASAGWGNMGTGAYTPAGALGSSHSARFHTSGNTLGGTVGILDLYLDFSTLAGTKELKFYHINTAGNDSVAVWISYDNGSSFTYLAKYTVSATWGLKVINLGTSTSNEVVLRFRCTSNQGGNTDPGIDEISITQPQPDMAVLNIVAPVTACNLTNSELVRIRLKNTGSMTLSNIPVIYHVDGSTVQETIPSSLNPGDTLIYTFITPADFSASGAHVVSSVVHYIGDYNPLNDSTATLVNNIIPIATFPFVEDFEDMSAENFSLTHGTNANIGIESAIGNNGSNGLRMAGNVAGTWASGSGSSTTALQAWTVYTDHQAFAMTCLIDATSLTNPEMKLDLRQTFINGGGSKYSWFRVLINDTVELANNNGVIYFNPLTSNSDLFVTQTINLSAFASTSFKLTLQSSCKYNDANAGGGTGDNVFIDNIIIKEKPAVELALKAWIGPLTQCGLTSHETVTIQMKNQGSSALGSIPVSYSIDGGLTWHQEVCPANIQPDSTLTFAFAGTADFSVTGTYHCLAAIGFPGDADPSNDTVAITVTSVPFITLPGFYQENFENGTGGWSSGSVSGTDEWVLGTPAKVDINSAHSGSNAWVTDLTQDYAINTNTYVVSPCFDFTNLNNPYLWVWLRLKTENNYDAMIMEVSVNDSTWYKITADAGFYNNTSNQLPVPPPKWSGDNLGWTRYMTSLPGLAHQPKVQIRFRFVSDYIQVDEGVAIDDIAIFDPFPDAAVSEIISPVSSCDLTNQEAVTAVFKNDGMTDIVGFTASYTLDNNPTIHENVMDTLPVGGSATYTFTALADLSSPNEHEITVGVSKQGDMNVSNDQLINQFYNTASTTVPLSVDFSTPYMYDHLSYSTALLSSYSLSALGAPDHSVMLSGGAAGNWPNNTDTSTTASQAWTYINHLADIHTCNIYLPVGSPVGLWFDLRQTYSQGNKYSWVRVLINDTLQIADIMGNMNFNPSTPNTDPFENHMFVLTPYGPGDLKVTIQSSCKYDEANSPVGTFDAAFIDNFRIDIIESVPETGDAGFSISPNPSNSTVNITFSKALKDAVVEIINLQGQEVFSEVVSGKQLVMDVHSLPDGIYAVRVMDNTQTLVKKFVKTR